MRRDYSGSTVKEIKELLAVLEPYAYSWKEWTQSRATFLSPKEILLIESFLETGNHNFSCKALGINPAAAQYLLCNSKLRLHIHRHLFESWLTERLLENHGIIYYVSDVDRFLNSPLQFLPINYELRTNLCRLHKTTIRDLLNTYPLGTISAQWYMTELLLQEFIYLLKEYQCLHLLKK